MTTSALRWRIIVPLKASARGKSRIDLPAAERRELAMAMAHDTVVAASSSGRVLAVVEDEGDGAALDDIPGVDVHVTSVVGLNEAILDGLAVLLAADPAGPVAVLPGDLPALTAPELAAALELCAAHRFAVVPDHEDVGTTLLAATDPLMLSPLYGPDSLRRHLRAGAVLVEIAPDSGLRLDVDTAADAVGAAGPRTSAVLLRLGRVRRTA